jgi:uncharacterized membrane protein YkgB
MSRLSGPEQIVIRPSNNVYTALAGAGVVALIVGLLVLYMAHKTVFGVDLFS